MVMKKLKMRVFLTVFLTVVASAGCRPKTASEKVKDEAEDVTHETGQAVERAGERVKDAAN